MSGGRKSENRGAKKVPVAAKVPPEDRRRIRAAAEYLGVSCSRLIGEAAAERAVQVLAGTAVEAEFERIDARGEDDD